ncbi:amidohydrolase family protein [Streptomyces niveus]|uniref:amidohydrolase family protein n=1 Tax=Streptomyces niveus TaxID=193462 RepID=UPI0038367432
MVAVSPQRGGSTIEPAHAVGATVIDGSGRDPGDVDVTIENGRITRLGTSSAHRERLDAKGLTMTPGLIGAHVHLGLSSPIQPHFSLQISAAEIAADIFATTGTTLDAGFTTVRDTGGVEGGAVTATAKGKVRGPRVLSCGPVQCQIGGHGQYEAGSVMAGNADKLRHNVATELSLRAALETPMEALVAAPPSGQVGVITPGAQADLVLWNGNSLKHPELFPDPTKAVLVLRAGQIVKDLR